MMKMNVPLTGLVLALSLSGCVSSEGTSAPRGDGTDVIATGLDKGRDTGVLQNGRAAIVYDPDGCQNWMIDDGLEGYASPRYDPVSGLPICNNLYPPGTVLRDYQTAAPGIRDRVSGPGRKTVVVRR